ncbi:carbamoyl-phosphate synthase large subunit [Klebsiella pneumoniae]|uniref:Carbamoyl-phosphate synthase large subunit n=1 Tax=Klebsiella pneumoniae TaxID=573 RepID=A0A377XP28_KLEPN|nr:carbamoyl-phosphate synthase large subunit [Klebsiella pneumoniae]
MPALSVSGISLTRFRAGLSVDGVFNLTNIDRWFLVQIEELVRLGRESGGSGHQRPRR